MPVAIGNGFGGVIFHEACGHGLEASGVALGQSVFAGKMGQKIANEKVTAIDDGTIPNAWGSINIDDEGTPAQKNVLMNLFHISVISDIAKDNLEYHVAHKKCDYMNEAGELVKATEPNAYKFEAFLFDAFERLDEIGVLRYHREECFAPIKNATGNDSPETARALYEEYYHL